MVAQVFEAFSESAMPVLPQLLPGVRIAKPIFGILLAQYPLQGRRETPATQGRQGRIVPIPIEEVILLGIIDMTGIHHDVAIRFRRPGQRVGGIEMARVEKTAQVPPQTVQAVETSPGGIILVNADPEVVV